METDEDSELSDKFAPALNHDHGVSISSLPTDTGFSVEDPSDDINSLEEASGDIKWPATKFSDLVAWGGNPIDNPALHVHYDGRKYNISFNNNGLSPKETRELLGEVVEALKEAAPNSHLQTKIMGTQLIVQKSKEIEDVLSAKIDQQKKSRGKQ